MNTIYTTLYTTSLYIALYNQVNNNINKEYKISTSIEIAREYIDTPAQLRSFAFALKT